jgi:hypothetical protein
VLFHAFVFSRAFIRFQIAKEFSNNEVDFPLPEGYRYGPKFTAALCQWHSRCAESHTRSVQVRSTRTVRLHVHTASQPLDMSCWRVRTAAVQWFLDYWFCKAGIASRMLGSTRLFVEVCHSARKNYYVRRETEFGKFLRLSVSCSSDSVVKRGMYLSNILRAL